MSVLVLLDSCFVHSNTWILVSCQQQCLSEPSTKEEERRGSGGGGIVPLGIADQSSVLIYMSECGKPLQMQHIYNNYYI